MVIWTVDHVQCFVPYELWYFVDHGLRKLQEEWVTVTSCQMLLHATQSSRAAQFHKSLQGIADMQTSSLFTLTKARVSCNPVQLIFFNRYMPLCTCALSARYAGWDMYTTALTTSTPSVSRPFRKCCSLDASQAYGLPRRVTGIALPKYILKTLFVALSKQVTSALRSHELYTDKNVR